MARADAPKSVRGIHDRVLEISFNAASWTEMAAVGMLLTFVEQGLLDRDRFGRFRFHLVESSDLEKLPASSKLNNLSCVSRIPFRGGPTKRQSLASRARHRARKALVSGPAQRPAGQRPGWRG